jgi:phage-related protein
MKKLPVRFFAQESGNEPVRDWLKDLSADDRKRIGDDIKTAELGWPVGMPLCKPMGQGLHEIRTDLDGGRISRVFVCAHKGHMILLHGIIKKSQKTPKNDLDIARTRMRGLK